jgi:hypothetical protein
MELGPDANIIFPFGIFAKTEPSTGRTFAVERAATQKVILSQNIT